MFWESPYQIGKVGISGIRMGNKSPLMVLVSIRKVTICMTRVGDF